MSETSKTTEKNVAKILDYMHSLGFDADEEEWDDLYSYIEAKLARQEAVAKVIDGNGSRTHGTYREWARQIIARAGHKTAESQFFEDLANALEEREDGVKTAEV